MHVVLCFILQSQDKIIETKNEVTALKYIFYTYSIYKSLVK